MIMKKSYGAPGVVAIFATLLISIIGAQGLALADEKVWTLQERTLPAPAAASEVLRDSIATAPQPDVSSNKGFTLETTEEWSKFIHARDEATSAIIKPLADRFKVTIKEEKVAGVTVWRVTPANINPLNQNRLFVYAHGGGYVINN